MTASHTAFSQSLQTALSMAQSGRLGEAEALLSRLLEQWPDQPDALQLMGLVKRGQGDQIAAIEFFQRSLAMNPAQPHVLNNLGNALLASARRDEAVAAYRRAIALNADYADARLNLGRLLLDDGHLDEARHVLEQATKLAPGSVKIWSAYGRALRALADYEQAVAAFEQALRIKPDHVPALHNLAVTHFVAGRAEQSLHLLDQCLARQPDLALAHYNRGHALYELGRTDEAIQSYELCIALAPDYREGHDTLNKLFWQHGMGDHYLKSYQTALQKVPQALDLWIDWADKLILAEQCGEAVAAVAGALDQGHDDARLSHVLGRALMGMGQYGKAQTALIDATDRPDAPLAAVLDLSRCCLLAKSYREAEQAAEKALRRAPLDQEALAWRALSWRFLGDAREPDLNDYERFIGVFDLPAPPGYASIEAFNERLAACLRDLHKAHQHPMEQTLRGGSQTMGSLFSRDYPEIQQARALFEAAIKDYIKALPDDPAHVFLNRKSRDFSFSGSWSVRLHRHGFHVNHVHAKGWISSCYYVELPPSTHQGDGQQGWIKFGESSLGLGGEDAIQRVIQPKPGRLVLFPSYVYHGTIPFDDEAERLTIAFDVVPD
ncbi:MULTISPECIES: tetratricopeptide repeat protein [unclassified Iodidimonas]|uniref:tetratricopeptide repeat protein n=1 Tax=unclassified Iodidimonas TaxID=2626145 RepID=UPI0024831D7B|nr:MULTISPECIES: tetratricopeptide repeat protein [unclassified Iodidimonas]